MSGVLPGVHVNAQIRRAVEMRPMHSSSGNLSKGTLTHGNHSLNLKREKVGQNWRVFVLGLGSPRDVCGACKWLTPP